MQILLVLVRGNSATATRCSGNSATASKLQTARNIKVTGAVNGNANFDGSENIEIQVKQDNIKTLTGSVTAEGEDYGAKAIDYPAGYNKDNCICIASATRMYENKEWNYGIELDVAISLLTGGGLRRIILNTSNINVALYNYATSQKTIYYKIVLMKIA